MDTEPYLAGILAGIMAVAVVTAILTAVRKKQGRPKPEYDERQMAARGVAYRWAFLTLMLSLAVNTGVEAIWGPWAKPGVSAWMLIFLSIGVFIVACVRKDAYFAVAQNPRTYLWLFGAVVLCQIPSIRMMLNMLSRDGGEVLWNGEPLDISRCNVGYLAEERGLYPKYALMDQLLYFASLRDVPRAEARRRIRYWAQRLEVEEYLYPSAPAQTGRRGLLGGSAQREKPKRPDQLSKGNQQKIQLMAALLSDPELLILDEPLSGLDPINTDLFKGIIREEIEAGKYLIMSSHQMATVEEFCTDLTILDRSRTVLQGHLNDIKKGYGRVHLQLKTEEDAGPYIAESGAQIVTRKEFEYQLKVTGQEQANDLLARLTRAGVTVVLFNLREPSLHEIFVETVGGESDA